MAARGARAQTGRTDKNPEPSRPRSRIDAPAPAAPLTGKLRDETGDRLTPTHSTKDGRRIRYYVSSRLLRGSTQANRGPRGGDVRSEETPPADTRGWRLPAAALEHAAADAIAGHLEAAAAAHGLLEQPNLVGADRLLARTSAVVAARRRGTEDAGALANTGPAHAKGTGSLLAPGGWTETLCALLASGHLSDGVLHLLLDGVALAEAIGTTPGALAPTLLTLSVPFTLRRRGVELKLVAGSALPSPDAILVAALARAHRWARELREGRLMAEIATAERTSEAYIHTRTPLAFLSPRIQATVLAGTQLPELTLERLVRAGLPLDWCEKERCLGFAS